MHRGARCSSRKSQSARLYQPANAEFARTVYPFSPIAALDEEFFDGDGCGSISAAVTKGHIESVPLIIPSDTILRKFDSLNGPLFSAIDNGNSQSRTLTARRDAVLPKLISDELRVKAAEKIVEAVA